MKTIIFLLIVIGLLTDIWFIKTELAGKALLATVLKGFASLFFVILGFYCFIKHMTPFGRLIGIGLVLGMIGDILLNMRFLFEGKKSTIIFALGILSFLSGHFLYIAALISRNKGILPIAAIMTVVISLMAIPPLMKRIDAPSKGLKIFGYVYLVIVIAMFSCATSLLINDEASSLNIIFTIGGFLFMISDFIMIYYSFGKKLKPLRVTNLLCYYIGQILIACCILLA